MTDRVSRSSSSHSEDAVAREAGNQLVTRLYAALRVLKMYPVENERSKRALDELTEAGNVILDAESEIEIRVAGEFIFVNATRLRLGMDNYASFGHVISLLGKSDVGAVQVDAGVERREWQVFVNSLLAVAGTEPDDPRRELEQRLLQGGISHLSVESSSISEEEELDPEARKELAKRTYERGVGVTKDLVNSSRMGRQASLRKVKRAVQGLVDQVLNNELSIIGLTTIRDYDDYTFIHSVNVCIFALSIGKRLGLSKIQLYDLGMAAILHDLGKSRVPLEVLNKPGSLSDDEWAYMRAHPWLGVLAMFKLRGVTDVPYRGMIVAYQHHMKVSLSGYPAKGRTQGLSMFSKLVAVADIFDAATSRRVYATNPIQPDKILEKMMNSSDMVGVDPVCVKALVNLLGIYPVGTCVVLDSYELAIVHATNSDLTEINRPIVRMLIGDNGLPFSPPPLYNLAEKTPDGSYQKSIIKVVDPTKYNINPQDYFV